MAQLGNTTINGNLTVTGALTLEGDVDATIETATYAQKDLSGNVITSAYGATVTIAGTVLSLKSKDDQTLSTVAVNYGKSLTLASSILSLKDAEGNTLSTALISTADTFQAITDNGASTTNAILISNTTSATSTTTGALRVTGGVGVGGTLYATQVIGSYWNDYAEFREVIPVKNEVIEAGNVVCEKGDDTMCLVTQRLQAGAKIITDTFGMCIGETNIFTRPIALCGRVLAKTYEDRERFKDNIGAAVCAAPRGTVSIMTREEIKEYPDRIIGYIGSVPDYDTWGAKHIPVNNRVWIIVK